MLWILEYEGSRSIVYVDVAGVKNISLYFSYDLCENNEKFKSEESVQSLFISMSNWISMDLARIGTQAPVRNLRS